MPASTRRSIQKKQTRLSFSPLHSSSPVVDSRLANARYDGAPKSKNSAVLPTPLNSSQQRAPDVAGGSSNTSDDPLNGPVSGHGATPEEDLIRSNRLTQRKQRRIIHESSEGSLSDVEMFKTRKIVVEATKSSSRSQRYSNRLRSSNSNTQDPPSSPSSASSDEIRTPTKKPLTRSKSNRTKSASSPIKRSIFRQSAAHDISDIGSPETSGDEDGEAIITRPSRRTRKRVSRVEGDFIVGDGQEDSEDDEDIASPAKRTRRSMGGGTPRRQSRQEKLDLEEDLEDLQDSVVKRSRTRGNPVDHKKLERQRKLEILRRRRAGEKIQDLTDSEDEAPPESELDGSQEGLEDSEVADTEPPPAEDLDDYDEDFVIEDDDTLGAPTALADMPLEFTMHQYKKPREHFKYVVEWMVHNKLNPAFSREDAIYQTAFFKLDDEVKGRAGSNLISSVWTVKFRRALEARPEIRVAEYSTWEGHGCDACNRTTHPASFDITFAGKPYFHKTLEPVSEDEDEDEEEEDDGKSRDSRGRSIPDQDFHFFVGRFCKGNATIAHTLCHWRYHLNEWILDFLKNQGTLDAEGIVERESWSLKRKTKFANEVVDGMEEAGEIQSLWKDFKNNLEAARESKPARWRGR